MDKFVQHGNMNMEVIRREYEINVFINGKRFTKLHIDPHYEKKHSTSINDKIILELVQQLNDRNFEPQYMDDNFEYYVRESLVFESKKYKLIWLIDKNFAYIGIVNAYRRK